MVADKDLSKLAIDKSKGTFQRRRSRRVFYWAALAVLLISLAGLYLAGVFTPPVSVQLGTVTQVYPSQAVTLLTASGYVVPQRKVRAGFEGYGTPGVARGGGGEPREKRGSGGPAGKPGCDRSHGTRRRRTWSPPSQTWSRPGRSSRTRLSP